MKNYSKYSKILILLLLIFADKSFSQLSLSTKFQSYYDDNIYNNYSKISDVINSFSLGSAYDFESEFNNLQIYYMGNFSYYQENYFKSSNSHKIGIVDTYLFSKNDNPLNIGVNYSFRNNRDDFTIYDFNLLSLYANYRQTIAGTNSLLIGYLFNYINYKNFSGFSYNENKAFIKFNTSFSSKTSLMAGIEFDNKSYIEKYNDPTITNNTNQLNGFVQISQDIGESTSLGAYFQKRNNLTTGTRYLSTNEYVYYEEEIFNDIYSNDGYETGISLSQLIGSSAMISIQGIFTKRNFSNLPVASPDGYSLNILREDKQYGFGAEIKVDLGFIFDDLIGSLNYNYINNQSNDYYYKYNNQIISAGIEWGL